MTGGEGFGMSARRRLRLWIWALALLFSLTAFCLPCVPCPPEAETCDGSYRVTPMDWLSLKITCR